MSRRVASCRVARLGEVLDDVYGPADGAARAPGELDIIGGPAGPEVASNVHMMPLPKICAAELMTENPRTVRVDDPIGEAVNVLQTMDFRHVPVVDEQGELVGMLSDRDLRALQSPYAEDTAVVGAAPRKASAPVSTIMSGNVVSASPDADVTELMELMLDNKIGALPIIDGEGALVGIVSYVDIFRGLLMEE
ncbi:CBS domain-containing protein [Sorangium sp. So ce145]|uniref:CBS domain-containing protein n=1 Tax=Sorangium sp. So ce145 TaxID=3133285 RepID=UPI003F61E618